ncbi:histidinol-phosphate transaminase [Ornithinicoccus halotolerans]|uniref:histidinol-phosphate transaminase n=1 Tax=Ornithinicoccus halotolerans TaxID=1748220 RepID=UPI001295DAE8|nr:histidinol-phosphate transaminase [Ornithinicoccus halotolerans]
MTAPREPAALPPFPTGLLREDLRDFAGYSSARTSAPDLPARVWLNANEAAEASAVDPDGRLRRYPDPQPAGVRAALADHYGVPEQRVVVGRGSDEAIELLVRTLCRPGGDGVVITSPTFGMYAVSARLHGVPVHDVPCLEEQVSGAWRVDVDAVAARARETGARLVFLASPGNPTGATVPVPEVRRLVAALADQAVVVLDEAYAEFAATPSLVTEAGPLPTLVVLRTLSKAHGLAGARVGVAVAHPDLVAVLRRVQAPYPVPRPVADLVEQALAPEATARTRERVAATLAARDRLAEVLAASPLVSRVHPGEANFVLVRSPDPDALLARLTGRGIVVRDLRARPELADAVRVTVGSDAEIEAVAAALGPDTATGSAGRPEPTDTPLPDGARTSRPPTPSRGPR